MSLRTWAHAVLMASRHIRNTMPVPELDVIRTYIGQGDVCIDVGGHGGRWSKPLSGLVPKGHVYTFEALPYYADVLRKTLALFGIRNVTVLNQAVMDKPGTVNMVWQNPAGQRLTGKTHVRSGQEDASGTVSVPAVRLDDLMPKLSGRKVSFIKMDIEGAELFALRGASALIDAQKPVVYTEVDPRWLQRYGFGVEDVFSFLQEKAYKAYTIQGGRMAPANAENYDGRDVLFVPEG